MTYVLKYGLLPPITNQELISEQLFLGHKSRNGYIAAIRNYREQLRAEMRKFNLNEAEETVRILDGECRELKGIVKAHRILNKSKKVPLEISEDLKKKRELLKTARKALSEKRKEINSTIQDTKDILGEEKNRQKREVYNAGAFWGTELIIRKAVDQADSSTPLFDGLESNDPKFKRWDGSGQIGIELPKGFCGERLNADNTWVMIIPNPGKTTGKRSVYKSILRIKVDSNGPKQPIFADFPLILHRPIPKDAIITWVTVNRRKNGPSTEWSVDFTVNHPNELPQSNTMLAVAFDIGWRKLEDGVRIGTFLGEDKESIEFKLGTKIVNSLKKESELQSTRTKEFTKSLSILTEYLMGLNNIPEWILKASKSKKSDNTLPTMNQAVLWISQWRSEKRLSSLIKNWKLNRIDGDEDIFSTLEEWRYHDFHLWRWESSQRKKSRLQRRELYRIFSLALAKKYRTLILEDFNLTDVKKRSDFGTKREVERNDGACSNLQLVSPGEFKSILISAFKKRGGRVVQYDPAFTSQKCPKCGMIEKIGMSLHHVCSGCGTEWDRDNKASINLLNLWIESPGEAEIIVRAREDEISCENNEIVENKFDRVRKNRKEKVARMEAARNLVSKAAE